MTRGLFERVANVWSPISRRSEITLPPGRRGVSASSWSSNRTEQLATMGAVGTVFGIVDRISTSQSAIEWQLLRRTRSGRKEDRVPVTSHLALDLWRKPNDYMTGSSMIEMGQQHYELTGETWLVLDRDDTFRSLVLGMWPVRPDRIEPVPGDGTEFLAGYVYTSVDGTRVPLRTDEVLSMKRPNPLDPYRGLGAIQATLLDIQSTRAAAEWNRNFFKNGAMPAGVIEIPTELDDTQWRTLMMRWDEQFRGVSRAHRVGTLEHGSTFTPISYNAKDMQITEARGLTRDAIMEAFGVSRPMLGITDDVNRANAEAGEYVYAKYVDVPRANRWRDMLNTFYLPMFGDTVRNLEFDFVSPIPDDEEADARTMSLRATAAKTLRDAGFAPDDITAAVGLPPMEWVGDHSHDPAEGVPA